MVFLQNQELCENEIFFLPGRKRSLRASRKPPWVERRKVNLRDNKKKRNAIPYYGAWSCTLRSTNRMEKKINGAAGEKKIGYGVKMLVYNHTVTQQTLFCGAKKENGAAGKKKIRGTVPLQAERAKILRFHHSSHLGDLGVGRGAPKSAQKCPLFFFFSPPKIQNYAMSHNSVYGAISLFFTFSNPLLPHSTSPQEGGTQNPKPILPPHTHTHTPLSPSPFPTYLLPPSGGFFFCNGSRGFWGRRCGTQ